MDGVQLRVLKIRAIYSQRKSASLCSKKGRFAHVHIPIMWTSSIGTHNLLVVALGQE